MCEELCVCARIEKRKVLKRSTKIKNFTKKLIIVNEVEHNILFDSNVPSLSGSNVTVPYEKWSRNYRGDEFSLFS